jgi:hypothetical protein
MKVEVRMRFVEVLLPYYNGEYAGKLGTGYSDWQTAPQNVPTPRRGDRL